MGPSSLGVSLAACGLIASTLLAAAATAGGPPAPRPVRRHPWSPRLEVSVWVPRPLSQVADYPEYDLSLHVTAEGRPVQSRPVRLRLRHP
jgi:hypothetical protein